MMSKHTNASSVPSAVPDNNTQRIRRRSLVSACAAHAVHDGMTDLIAVLLPIWQTQFALSYALVGLIRGIYSGVMACCQLMASRLVARFGRKNLLVFGTALAAVAWLVAGQAEGLLVLLLAMVVGGLGGSTQHPLASSLVADSHEAQGGVKEALSHYNFAGDIGKTLVPAFVGILLTWVSWRISVSMVGVLGLIAAFGLWWFIPSDASTVKAKTAKVPTQEGQGSVRGLRALVATGVLDSSVRMGFLTFLPFLLKDKGSSTAGIGLALSLLFIGGAFGKLLCGYLGSHIGMMKTVWITESMTAVLILVVLSLPLVPCMVVLPLIGLALNGTSSVLYGTVPDLAPQGKREQAFAWFYTGTIGAGALSPILFGHFGDGVGIFSAVEALAGVVLLTLPLAWIVARELRQ